MPLLVLAIAMAMARPLQAQTSNPRPAKSAADIRRELVELFQTRLLQNARIDGQAWEQTARQMVTLTANAMANERSDPLLWPMDTARPEELAALADRLIGAGVEDPNLLFCCLRAYSRSWRDEDARKITSRLKGAKFPSIIDFAFQTERCNLSLDVADWKTIPGRRTQAVWAAARYTGKEQQLLEPLLRLALMMTRDDQSRYYDLKDENTLMAQTSRQAGVHPWLVEMLQGQLDSGDAWEARGTATVDKVNPGIWPMFNARLISANKHFTAASELMPEMVDPLAGLINNSKGPGELAMPIFDRAIAIQFDNSSVWGNTEYALLPQWGGSFAEMLQTGRRGLEGDRYDTLGPYRFVHMARTAERFRPSPRAEAASLWRDAELVDQTIAVLQKYADDAGETDLGARFQGLLLQHAMDCGRYDVAKEAAMRLAKLPVPIAPMGTSAVPDVELSRAHAYASDQRQSLEEAKKLLADDDPAAAKAAAEKVLSNLPPEHPGRLYAEHLLGVANAQLQFRSGEWVNLTPTEHMTGWKATSGQWRWNDGVFEAEGTERGAIRIESELHVHGPMEYVARLDIPRPTADALARIGIALIGKSGSETASIGVNFFPLFGEFQAAGARQQRLSKKGAAKQSIELRIRIESSGVTVWDGEKSYPFGDAELAKLMLDADFQPVVNQFATYETARMRAIIREVRLRKLPDNK
jgi:hypothetical protein